MNEAPMTNDIDQLIEQGLHGQPGAINSAIDRVQELQDSDTRDLYFGKIIQVLLKLGDWAKAFDMAKQIQHSVEKKDALLAIADHLITIAQNQDVESVLVEAENTVFAIGGERYWLWQKAEALDQIALLRLKIEQKNNAEALWQQAIEIAKLGQGEVNNPQEIWDSSGVLADIAQNLARAGDFVLAKSVANEIRIEKRRNATLDTIAAIERSKC